MPEIKKLRLRFVTDKKGKKTDVIMKGKDFEELLEDLNDLAIVAERRRDYFTLGNDNSLQGSLKGKQDTSIN